MDVTEFTWKQRCFLVNLNKLLLELVKNIRRENLQIGSEMKRRVSDKNDWINDYAQRCNVCVYLRQDDPAYSTEGNNVIAEFTDKIDFSKIELEDMLRIGDIWVDIKITLQHHLNLA